jgi:hypothetical protein
MSERSERTNKHGRYDGGARGTVIGHWCPAAGTTVNAAHGLMEHQ